MPLHMFQTMLDHMQVFIDQMNDLQQEVTDQNTASDLDKQRLQENIADMHDKMIIQIAFTLGYFQGKQS